MSPPRWSTRVAQAQSNNSPNKPNDFITLLEKTKKEIILSVKEEIRIVLEKLSTLEERMNSYEKNLVSINNKQSLQESKLQSLSEEVRILKNDLPSTMLQETNLRRQRANNVVISGIPEPEKGSVEE